MDIFYHFGTILVKNYLQLFSPKSGDSASDSREARTQIIEKIAAHFFKRIRQFCSDQIALQWILLSYGLCIGIE